MKKKALCCCVFILLVGLTGCSPRAPVSTHDEEAFLIVTAYVYDIIPALKTTKFDLDEYARDFDDLGRLNWLEHDVEVIVGINERHLTADFLSLEEIAGWTVPVARDGKSWVIEGEELANAVEQIISTSQALVEALHDLVAAEGNIGKQDWDNVCQIIGDALNAVQELERLYNRG